MTENNTEKRTPTPLIMNAVYRVSDAQTALGIGRRAMEKLKRAGLPIKRVANKDYLNSNDLWEVMPEVKPKRMKPESASA